MTETSTAAATTNFTLPRHEYVTVSPQLAEEWLGRNQNNRNIRPRRVETLARKMREGKWTVSNDDICFDTTGTLVNGQHRLSAVIASGETIVIGVKFGVPTEAFANMDTQAPRTAGDLLNHNGEADAVNLAASVRMYFRVRRFLDHDATDFTNVIVTPEDVVDTLDALPSLRDSFRSSNAASQRYPALPRPVATVAHSLIAQAGNGMDLANFYLSQLSLPADEPLGSAIHVVRSRLDRIKTTREQVRNHEHLFMLLKGWNHWAMGQSIRVIYTRPKADFYFPQPVVAPANSPARRASEPLG